MRVSYIRIMLRVTVRNAKAKARAKGKENSQENTKSEGKGIDKTQWKATAKAKGRQRHGEHQRKDLVRGQALREGLKERQNRDQEEQRRGGQNGEQCSRERCMEGQCRRSRAMAKENTAQKAKIEGQRERRKGCQNKRPKGTRLRRP